ncbi:MAG: UDP-N-acetylglucosamine 1-carboxyvinyltransferase, partial [Chloroflexota bacterium]
MRIRVEGGHPLNGTYTPSGNSNAAISLLAAALLAEDTVTLHNVPDTISVQSMLEIASSLGASVARDDHSVRITTPQIIRRSLTGEKTSGFTGALLYLAPILIRREFVRLELDFPLNRIRTHLEAMRDLGLDIVTVDGGVEIRPATWGYHDILLTQTSVTATAIVMMLAAHFGKETIIRNAASEPHLQQLAHLLERMGAQVQGVRSNVLHIFGKEGGLHGAEYTIGPDHIETASIAAIAAMLAGRVRIEGINHSEMRMIGKIYRRLGVNLDIGTDDIFVP